MKVTVFLVLFILSTCQGQKKTAGENAEDMQEEGTQETDSQNPQDSDHGLIRIASDFYSGTEQAETLIIRNAKGLQKFYSKINRTRKPGLPVPDIDFSEEMVIVRCSGTVDDGAMPQLYMMEETDNQVVLGIRETDAASDSSAVTTPFSVYRMAIPEKKVSVNENSSQ